MNDQIRFYVRGKQEIFELWDEEEQKSDDHREFPLGQSLADFLCLNIPALFGHLQKQPTLEAILKTIESFGNIHPFFNVLQMLQFQDYETAMEQLAKQASYLKQLQQKVSVFMKTCLTMDLPHGRKDASLYFHVQTGGFSPELPRCKFTFVPEKGDAHARLAHQLKEIRKTQAPTPTVVKRLHAVAAEIVFPQSVEDYLVYFYAYFLRHGLRFKTCKYCGRYFAILGSANADYCTRPYSANGKTCREVGAIRLYQSKKQDDPVSRLYTRAYKKYFAWIKYGKFTKEEFSAWSEQARLHRDMCSEGKITLEEFSRWLNVRTNTHS